MLLHSWLLLCMAKMVIMQAFYSSISEYQVGTDLLKMVICVDVMECGIWCSQLVECKSYKTEKVKNYTVSS